MSVTLDRSRWRIWLRDANALVLLLGAMSVAWAWDHLLAPNSSDSQPASLLVRMAPKVVATVDDVQKLLPQSVSVIPPSTPEHPPQSPLPLNQKIVDFAVPRIGQQVGNGECWTLADQALKAAGAEHPSTYVWGRALTASEEVYPGDVFQFTSVRLEKGGNWQLFGMPNHTAIVTRVLSPGNYIILHQNFGEAGRTVSECEIDLSTKTQGEFVIYRPVQGRAQ